MIVAIHQPQYLPWLGYFDKIDRADTFVLLDNVQYKKNEWQNRNRIKTAQGWQWLTVPVLHDFPAAIRAVKTNPHIRWERKHWQALTTNYHASPHFARYREVFAETFARKWAYLVDINIHLIRFLVAALGIETPILLASDLTAEVDPTLRIIHICKKLGADTYLSGKNGVRYLVQEKFAQERIHLVFQEFRHPVYPQLYGEFIPGMAAIDLLLNCGEESLTILRGGQDERTRHRCASR